MTLVLGANRLASNIDNIIKQYDLTYIQTITNAEGVGNSAKEFAIASGIKHTEHELTDELISKAHSVLIIWSGSVMDDCDALIKRCMSLNKRLETFQYVPVTISLDHKGVDIKDHMSIEGTNRHEIYTHICKGELPHFSLSKHNQAVLYSKDEEVLWAVIKYFSTRLYLTIEGKRRHTPIDDGLFHLSKELDIEGMTAFTIHNRIHPFNTADIIQISKPTSVALYDMLYDDELDKGVELIHNTIQGKYVIFMVTDSDADGTDSAALGYRYFKSFHNAEVHVFVNERRYGNGVNEHLTDLMTRKYYQMPDDVTVLIITADHGSSNESSYKELKALGDNIFMIVTDHHILPSSGRPTSCDAHINPQDPLSTLPPYISGCTVLFALLLKYHLTHRNGTLNSLNSLIPYSAITVVSDMMDLSKPINRYIWQKGVEVMQTSKFGTWCLFRDMVKTQYYLTDTFSRGWIPYINACNRMGDAYKAFLLLVSSNIEKSIEIFNDIDRLNNSRKRIQKQLTKSIPEGIDNVYSVGHLLDTSVLSASDLKHASGVIGIVANGIGDKYGKPCFIFVKQAGVIKGSGRGIAKNISIGRAIDYVKEKMPDLFIKGGGHKGAGGCELKDTPETLTLFNKYLDETILTQSNGVLRVVNNQDIVLPLERINSDFMSGVANMSPMGMGFEPLMVTTTGVVSGLRKFGSMCTFNMYNDNGYSIKVLSFNATGLTGIDEGCHTTVRGEVNIDQFSGRITMFI